MTQEYNTNDCSSSDARLLQSLWNIPSIDQHELKKAMNKTGMVQVQRQVSRGGKTFTQNYWVKSSEVKSSDKVVGHSGQDEWKVVSVKVGGATEYALKKNGKLQVDTNGKPFTCGDKESAKNMIPSGDASTPHTLPELMNEFKQVEGDNTTTGSKQVARSLDKLPTDTRLYYQTDNTYHHQVMSYTKKSNNTWLHELIVNNEVAWSHEVDSQAVASDMRSNLVNNHRAWQVMNANIPKTQAKDQKSSNPSNTIPNTPMQDNMKSKEVFDILEFEKLKSDKVAAIKYLKDHGITWNENPHEGVNWMRASMAAKKASTTPAHNTAKVNDNK